MSSNGAVVEQVQFLNNSKWSEKYGSSLYRRIEKIIYGGDAQLFSRVVLVLYLLCSVNSMNVTVYSLKMFSC